MSRKTPLAASDIQSLLDASSDELVTDSSEFDDEAEDGAEEEDDKPAEGSGSSEEEEEAVTSAVNIFQGFNEEASEEEQAAATRTDDEEVNAEEEVTEEGDINMNNTTADNSKDGDLEEEKGDEKSSDFSEETTDSDRESKDSELDEPRVKKPRIPKPKQKARKGKKTFIETDSEEETEEPAPKEMRKRKLKRKSASPVQDIVTVETDPDDPVEKPVKQKSSEVKSKSLDKDEGSNKLGGRAPSWQGQRLYGPSKRTANPSKVWSYSGFRKDIRGQLIKTNIVCGECGTELKYQQSPGAMSQHLMRHHGQIYNSVSEVKPKPITDYLVKKKVIKYSRSDPKQKRFDKACLKLVVKSNRPLNIMNDEGLKDMINIADEKLTLPSDKKIGRDISQEYAVKKAELKDALAKIEFFSGTNDAGSSSNCRSFIDINVHYLTEEFEMKKAVLAVVEMVEAKNAENYRNKVAEVEEEFGVKGKVIAYTTDNEATMHKAFKDDVRMGCLAHIESKASKKALKNQKCLNKLRSKCRRVVKYARKSCKFKYALQRNQARRKLRKKTLQQEVDTRFTSCHTMLRSILNDPNEKKDDESDMKSIRGNISAINETIDSSNLKRPMKEKLKFKEKEVEMIMKLVEVLDELEEMITLLGGQKYSTSSSVLPILKQFYKCLEIKEDDPLWLYEFKQDLTRETEERCKVNLDRSVLLKCSFFDKRYSNLTCVEDEDEKKEVFKEIKSEAKQLEREDKQNRIEGEEDSSVETPKKKKSRFLGLGLADCDGDVVQKGAVGELKRYYEVGTNIYFTVLMLPLSLKMDILRDTLTCLRLDLFFMNILNHNDHNNPLIYSIGIKSIL